MNLRRIDEYTDYYKTTSLISFLITVGAIEFSKNIRLDPYGVHPTVYVTYCSQLDAMVPYLRMMLSIGYTHPQKPIG